MREWEKFSLVAILHVHMVDMLHVHMAANEFYSRMSECVPHALHES